MYIDGQAVFLLHEKLEFSNLCMVCRNDFTCNYIFYSMARSNQKIPT